MPNQRKEGQRAITAWVPEELRDELKRMAASRGVPLSTLVEELLRNELELDADEIGGKQRGRDGDGKADV